MKRIEDFTADELSAIWDLAEGRNGAEWMQAVLDYIKANLDTGKTEPMSVEEIERVLLDDDCTTYIDARKLGRLCKLIQLLTVQQGFVVDWSKAPINCIGWRPYWIIEDEALNSHFFMIGGPVSDVIPRPAPNLPKAMRKRTREEKIHELHELHVLGGKPIRQVLDSTIDDLCQAAGIALEVSDD